MNLEVLTPDKNLFSGEVEGVLLPGVKGQFQILNNHAPIIAALSNGEIKIKSKEGENTLNVKAGFVECLNNKIVVLVEGEA